MNALCRDSDTVLQRCLSFSADRSKQRVDIKRGIQASSAQKGQSVLMDRLRNISQRKSTDVAIEQSLAPGVIINPVSESPRTQPNPLPVASKSDQSKIKPEEPSLLD